MEHARDYATLAHGAYESLDKAHEMANEHGYEVVHELSDSSAKRSHTVFKHKDTGEHVLSYRGTDPKKSKGKDLLTDIGMVFGKHNTKHFKESERVLKSVQEKIGDAPLTLTGHSLGGSTAIHNGKKSGLKSVTFNPYISSVGGMKKGLHKYFKDSDSETHINLKDDIGTSAALHIPKSHIVAHENEPTKHSAHSIRTFHESGGGIRLGKKKQVQTVAKRIGKGVAIGVGTAAAVGLGIAANIKNRTK